MILKNAFSASALIVLSAFNGQARTSSKIPCAQLPAKVSGVAAKHELKAGTQASCEQIDDGGKMLFEVKITSPAGAMQEFIYRSDGSLEEFEEESDIEKIPRKARSALENATSNAQLRKVDTIQRGATRLYEGEYTEAGEKKKIIVDANGTVILK